MLDIFIIRVEITFNRYENIIIGFERIIKGWKESL